MTESHKSVKHRYVAGFPTNSSQCYGKEPFCNPILTVTFKNEIEIFLKEDQLFAKELLFLPVQQHKHGPQCRPNFSRLLQ